ncbi:MAG: glycosyltransferase family 39 protein [bacterium]
MDRSRKRAVQAFSLTAILGVALAVRLLYLQEISRYPSFFVPYAGGDAALYGELAQRVAAGDLALGTEVYHYSPLYAYMLGLSYALFGESPWVARLLNTVLGTGTVALVCLCTGRLFRSASAGLLAGLAAALYGPFVVFDTSGLKTSLGLFLTALCLWIVAGSRRPAGLSRWAAAGAAAGLAWNLNGFLTLFVIGLFLWSCLPGAASRPTEGQGPSRPVPASRGLPAVGFLLSSWIVIAPFFLRNWLVTGEPVLTTSTGGIHFYLGNNERAWGGYQHARGVRGSAAGHFHDARRVAEEELGRPLTASEVSAYWKGKGLEFIRTRPKEFGYLIMQRAQMVVSPYEVPENENYQYLRSRSRFLSGLPGSGFLLPLGLAGLVLSLARPGKTFLLLLFFATYGAALLLGLVTWRYRLPLTLALLPSAAFLIVTCITAMREKRLRLAGACIFLTACGWMAGRAYPVSEFQSGRDMTAAHLRMEGSRREILLLQELSSTALSASPADRDRLWVRLAELRKSLGDLEGSAAVLQRALQENSERPRLWHALAVVSEELGREDAAEEARETARRKSRPPP